MSVTHVTAHNRDGDLHAMTVDSLTPRLLESLASTSLFRSIDAERVKSILQACSFTHASYQAGTFIRRRGDRCKDLLLLLRGQVSATFQNVNGKILEIERMKAPSVLVPAFLFAARRPLPVDVQARTDADILHVPKTDLLRACQDDATLLSNLLEEIADKVSLLADKLFFISMKTLEERVATYLLRLQDEKGSSVFRLPVSKEELSDLLGAARPSISRVFMEFQKTGLISQSGRLISILDHASLRSKVSD